MMTVNLMAGSDGVEGSADQSVTTAATRDDLPASSGGGSTSGTLDSLGTHHLRHQTSAPVSHLTGTDQLLVQSREQPTAALSSTATTSQSVINNFTDSGRGDYFGGENPSTYKGDLAYHRHFSPPLSSSLTSSPGSGADSRAYDDKKQDQSVGLQTSSTSETETTPFCLPSDNNNNLAGELITNTQTVDNHREQSGELQTTPRLSSILSTNASQCDEDNRVASMSSQPAINSNFVGENCFSSGSMSVTAAANGDSNGRNDLMINGLATFGHHQNTAHHQLHQTGTMATIIDQYHQHMQQQRQQAKQEALDSPSKTPSPGQSPLDDNNNANSDSVKSPTSVEALQLLRSATPQSAGISIQNQAAYKQTLEYLKQLFADRERLQLVPYGVFNHLSRLLEQEIQRVRTSLIHIDGSADQRPALLLPEPEGETVQKSTKIYVPVDKYPDFNFIGRIIGPRGLTIRELEVDCGCKLYIRGKGSLRDRNREEKLRSQQNWEHLNDDLHVLIMVEDTENRAKVKLERAINQINKLLDSVISNKDEFKMRQLAELAILNDKFKSQTNASAAAAAASAVQAAAVVSSAGGSAVAESPAPMQVTLQMMNAAANNASSGQATPVSQVSPVSVVSSGGTPISHPHHAAQFPGHQQAAHAAAVAAAQAALTNQAQQAAAVAALQAANHPLQHQIHHQLHPSVALAAASQPPNAYQIQAAAAAAAAANAHHPFNSLFNPAVPAGAFAAPTALTPAGLDQAGLLFAAASPGSLLTAETLNSLAAVQFPVNSAAMMAANQKRFHPYGKKK